MDCKTANQLIHPYINKELDLETADAFMKHIRECRECKEELEIYFTVQAGIDNLDQDMIKTYDLKGQFEEELHAMQVYIRERHVMRAVKDVLLAVTGIGVILTSLLQLGIWF